MEKKYLKSAVKLFFKLNPIAPISGLSNEILCILVAQETVKLTILKVGGLKKNLPHRPICTTRVWYRVLVLDFFCIFNFDLW